MISDSPRQTWYLARGGCPVPASKKPPADAEWWCQEGDAEWTRVDRVKSNFENSNP